MAAKKRWSELSRPRRCAIIVAGAAQIALQAAALRDISKRTPAQANGPATTAPWKCSQGIRLRLNRTFEPGGRLAALSRSARSTTPRTG